MKRVIRPMHLMCVEWLWGAMAGALISPDWLVSGGEATSGRGGDNKAVERTALQTGASVLETPPARRPEKGHCLQSGYFPLSFFFHL